jgi:hypothetical protein
VYNNYCGGLLFFSKNGKYISHTHSHSHSFNFLIKIWIIVRVSGFFFFHKQKLYKSRGALSHYQSSNVIYYTFILLD